jgi:hypothetical protein
MGRVALEPELLDVEDDLGHVLLDARDRRELLVHVTDLDARDGRPLEGRQEDAPERVAERDAVAGLEGTGLVLGVRPGFLDGSICGVSSSIMSGGLPRVVLDHELLVEIERHLVAGWRGHDGAGQAGGVDREPLRGLVGRSVSLASLNGSRERCDSRTSIRSPGLSWNDGTLVARPLTAK